MRKVYNAGGIPDLIVDDPGAQRLFRDRESYVEHSSSLAGYETTGSPINDDDVEADA